MEATIFAYEDRDGFGRFCESMDGMDKGYSEDVVQYIRKDLVEKLKGYVVHKTDCYKHIGPAQKCTCGLTEVLKELE